LFKQYDKNAARKKIHRKIRQRMVGTKERPRLCVFRSLNHIYAQIIDDTEGRTLVAASTLDESLKGKLESGGNKEAAKQVGLLIAEKAREKGITKVVFDRAGYKYHGRVAALAEGARENGLEF
jgi:large subunit ribosomal protein L18